MIFFVLIAAFVSTKSFCNFQWQFYQN